MLLIHIFFLTALNCDALKRNERIKKIKDIQRIRTHAGTIRVNTFASRRCERRRPRPISSPFCSHRTMNVSSNDVTFVLCCCWYQIQETNDWIVNRDIERLTKNRLNECIRFVVWDFCRFRSSIRCRRLWFLSKKKTITILLKWEKWHQQAKKTLERQRISHSLSLLVCSIVVVVVSMALINLHKLTITTIIKSNIINRCLLGFDILVVGPR